MPADPIQQLEEELRLARLAGDVRTMSRLTEGALIVATDEVAPAHRLMHGELYRAGRLRLTRLETSEQVVCYRDCLSVVSVRTDVAGTLDGVPFSDVYRCIRMWRRYRKGWRVVVEHISPIAA